LTILFKLNIESNALFYIKITFFDLFGIFFINDNTLLENCYIYKIDNVKAKVYDGKKSNKKMIKKNTVKHNTTLIWMLVLSEILNNARSDTHVAEIMLYYRV